MTDTQMILEALNSFKNDVNSRFDKMDSRLDSMEGRLDSMEGRLDSMEGRLDNLENDTRSINSRLDNLENDMNTVKTKVTRLEVIVENDIKSDIRKLSEHQLGLREQLEEYKAQVDDRLGTSDLVNLLADYSRKHC